MILERLPRGIRTQVSLLPLRSDPSLTHVSAGLRDRALVPVSTRTTGRRLRCSTPWETVRHSRSPLRCAALTPGAEIAAVKKQKKATSSDLRKLKKERMARKKAGYVPLCRVGALLTFALPQSCFRRGGGVVNVPLSCILCLSHRARHLHSARNHSVLRFLPTQLPEAKRKRKRKSLAAGRAVCVTLDHFRTSAVQASRRPSHWSPHIYSCEVQRSGQKLSPPKGPLKAIRKFSLTRTYFDRRTVGRITTRFTRAQYDMTIYYTGTTRAQGI